MRTDAKYGDQKRVAKLTKSRCLIAAIVAALSVGACAENHLTPQTGTETGNPPVLNEGLIALVFTAGEVHIVGKPGAVKPGGIEVTATNQSTLEVFTAKSNADGSFDIIVGVGELDTYSLTAAQGSQTSGAVWVDRGGARLGQSNSEMCYPMNIKAESDISQASLGVDNSCVRDSDCLWVDHSSNCGIVCSKSLVSKAGAQKIEAARKGVNERTCADYLSAGCSPLLRDCDQDYGPPTCLDKVCHIGSWQQAPSRTADCVSAFDVGDGDEPRQVYWFDPQAKACVARMHSGGGGNRNRYNTRDVCEASCPVSDTSSTPTRMTEACKGMQADALNFVSIEASKADKACTQASDCTWQETATDCSDDCGRWIVSQAGAQYITEAVHVANKTYCGSFTSIGCTLIHPPCAPSIGELTCISGQCQLR